MNIDNLNTDNSPQAGDITVKRRLDTVVIARYPDPILAIFSAEGAIKLAHELLHHADIILKATAAADDD